MPPDAPQERHKRKSGRPPSAGRPFCEVDMASLPEGLSELRQTNRQLRQALDDCHQLLERTRELVRRTDQDNEKKH